MKCKGRVEPLTPPNGRCSRSECGIFQRLDKCSVQVSAKLYFQHGETKEPKSLFAFGAMVAKLAGNEDVSMEELLSQPMFQTVDFDSDVITGFTVANETQV